MKWLDDHKAVPSDMTNAVLAAATRDGDRALFDRFLTAAKAEKDRQQRGRIINSLGGFRNPELVREAQKVGMSDAFDARESLFLLFAGFGDPSTRRMPFEFVRDNYDAVMKRVPNAITGGGGSFIPQVAGGFCSAAERKEASDFFEERMKQVEGGPRVLAQVLEGITLCEARRNGQRASVAAFLEKY